MMKTMFGGVDPFSPNLLFAPVASATVPRAAQRSRLRRVIPFAFGIDTSSAQVQPRAQHRAARVQENRGLPETGAEQVVGGHALLCLVIERIEHIEEEFDAAEASDAEPPRQPQIEKRLRR